MTQKLTRDQQLSAVGQGLALGCRANGVTTLTGSKQDLQASFASAWNYWRSRTTFPSVKTGLDTSDFHPIVRKSSTRISYVAAWTHDKTLTAVLRDEGRSIEEAGEILAAYSGVPLADWQGLARLFAAAVAGAA